MIGIRIESMISAFGNLRAQFNRKNTEQIERPFNLLDKKPDVGDKVAISNKGLNKVKDLKYRKFFAQHVYQIVNKKASMLQGVRFDLHCGTTIDIDDAVVVPKETHLRT